MVETQFLRTFFSLIFLLYASYLDIKYREIDYRLWRSMMVLAAFFIFIDISRTNNLRLFITFIFVTALAALFSISLHYLGLVGGGDAKLLIALGAMFPFLQTSNFILPTFFLSVFTNES